MKDVAIRLRRLASLLVAEQVSLSNFKGIEKELVYKGVGEKSEWSPVPFSNKGFQASGVMAGFSAGKPQWIVFRPKPTGHIALFVKEGGKFKRSYPPGYGEFTSFKSIKKHLEDLGLPLGKTMAPVKEAMKSRKFRRRREEGKPEAQFDKGAVLGYMGKKIDKLAQAIALMAKSDVEKFFVELQRALSRGDAEAAYNIAYKARDTLNERGYAMRSIGEAVSNILGRYSWEKDRKIPMSTVKNIQQQFERALTGVYR